MIQARFFRNTLGVKLLFATVMLLLVAFFNFYCRKKLEYAYAEMLSYNQLYYPDEHLRIKSLKWDKNDDIKIEFNGNGIKEQNFFEVYSDSSKIYEKEMPVLKFRMMPGLKTYRIVANRSPDTIIIDIDYAPAPVYRTAGSSASPAVEISTASIPIGDKGLKSIEDWNWSMADNTDKAIIASYLRDSMRITKDDNTEEKVKKIALYILNITKGRYGIPSDSLMALGPIQQLNAVRKGMSRIWCGNYAEFFTFFATSSGLPVRILETGAKEGGVVNSPHSFTEVYLKEQQTWAYVDFTDGNVFVKKNNKFLNTVDIYRLLRINDEDSGMVATYFSDGALIDTPFYKTGFFGTRSLNKNNIIRFYYGNYKDITTHSNVINRVRNFFYAKPYYAIYTDNVSSIDWQFDLRLISNYLLLLSFLLWLFILVKFTYFFLRNNGTFGRKSNSPYSSTL